MAHGAKVVFMLMFRAFKNLGLTRTQGLGFLTDYWGVDLMG